MIALWWFIALIAPSLVIVACRLVAPRSYGARALAMPAALLALGFALLPSFFPGLAGFRLEDPDTWTSSVTTNVASLSAPLVALPALNWLVALATTPSTRLDEAGIGRTALGTVALTCAFLTTSPFVLTVIWFVSNALFLRALGGPAFTQARRNCALYLWASGALLLLGVSLREYPVFPGSAQVGLVTIVVSILIRKGIFPFHAWIPNALDRGRIGPTVMFCAPQLGTYVALVLVIPHASDTLLRVIAVLSLVTVVYGAALALVQRDARRSAGYLFISQSALVLAGLDCTSPEALAGALVLWVSSAVAFSGLSRTILALEARRGRLDLSRRHGGYEAMPLLASSFLVLGLACTGFPGTLGFVGEEMLLQGAVEDFPGLGLMLIAGSALTGVAVLRMYFALFCGTRSEGPPLLLKRREALTVGLLAGALVVGGLLPGPLVTSRYAVANRLLSEQGSTPVPIGD